MSEMKAILSALLDKHTPGQIIDALRDACSDRFDEKEFDENGDLEQPCLDWVNVTMTLDGAVREIEKYSPALGRKRW